METTHPKRSLWQTRFTSIVTLLVLAFLLLATATGNYILFTTEQQIRENTGAALQALLSSVHDGITRWEQEREFDLELFLKDPIVVRFAQDQLTLKRNPTSLINSNNLLELREYYRQQAERMRAKGFFIIAPDRISIASSRDENIGSKNLIHFHRPDLLNRAFQGDIVFIPPIESDVAIDEDVHTRSIFLAGPIRNTQGAIIAVGTLRLQPKDDLDQITLLGRIGNSGESYAIDPQGFMLTESRFIEQIKLIDQYQHHPRHFIRIEDPGASLFRTSTDQQGHTTDLPLTQMAASATQGQSAINTEGYRDYRGVRVIGAWLWDNKLKIGLASEIDEDEALAPYYALRTPLISGLFFSGFISLSLLAVVTIISRKNTALLQLAHDELEDKVTERTHQLLAAKEKAEEASRAKSDFLANVSHELRTPLTAIHGSIKLINSGLIIDDHQRLEMLQLGEQNTERLIHLVNDLLDVEKIQAGKLEYHFETVPLMPQIERAIAVNQGYAEKYHVSMRITQRFEDAQITIDTARFQQIMSNLLSNAIKYSPEHGTVEIRSFSDGKQAIISIIDHGPGIPKAFQDRVFDQFTQAETSSTRNKGGTGLGLNITYHLITAMQGTISFISEPGKGTTFTVHLPISNT